MVNAKLLLGSGLRAAVELLDTRFPRVGFRFKRDFYTPDMGFLLRLLARNGFRPDAAVDVGAYEGEWTLLCKQVFPGVQVTMVEPSAERRETLRTLCETHDAIEYRAAFLSAMVETVQFREQRTNSGAVPEGTVGAQPMAATTLDAPLSETRTPRPQLLKVDTQGYDLEVLRGAARTLQSVEVLVTEMSLIRLHERAPSFREFIDWLDDAGFRLLDIAGFIRRPADDALWQIDAAFVRKDSPLGAVERGWC